MNKLFTLCLFWVVSRPGPWISTSRALSWIQCIWESSICERQLHYPGNRTQDLILFGEISCWVDKLFFITSLCKEFPSLPTAVWVFFVIHSFIDGNESLEEVAGVTEESLNCAINICYEEYWPQIWPSVVKLKKSELKYLAVQSLIHCVALNTR